MATNFPALLRSLSNINASASNQFMYHLNIKMINVFIVHLRIGVDEKMIRPHENS